MGMNGDIVKALYDAFPRGLMRFRTTVWLIVFALAVPVAGADDTGGSLQTLTSGDRVRVEVVGRGKTLRATIESVTADEIVLRPVGTAEPLRLDLAQLQTLDVARGRRSQWRRGAAIGFLSGALVLGIAGANSRCTVGDPIACNILTGFIVLTGGVVTATAGALVGLAFKTDRWERVHERKPRVSLILAPGREATRFGLSVSF